MVTLGSDNPCSAICWPLDAGGWAWLARVAPGMRITLGGDAGAVDGLERPAKFRATLKTPEKRLTRAWLSLKVRLPQFQRRAAGVLDLQDRWDAGVDRRYCQWSECQRHAGRGR